MNESLPQSVVDRAYERDPASAAAEFGAEFRTDIESFVAREVVEACVPRGLYERPPQSGIRYVGACDPSGGSSDSFTLSIASRDGDALQLSLVREVRPPFSPAAVVEDFADTLKSYGISKVVGDRYAGEFPRELFRKAGITYELSDRPKSDIYRDTLPLLNSRRVQLLDNQRLINQLVGLERRTARSGRDSIDHSPGGHDDVCNSACLVLLACNQRTSNLRMGSLGAVGMGVELDPKTGRPLVAPAHNPLAPGPHQQCIPGPGLDATASLFNAQHNIRRPT
jgi:hypothetical protein